MGLDRRHTPGSHVLSVKEALWSPLLSWGGDHGGPAHRTMARCGAPRGGRGNGEGQDVRADPGDTACPPCPSSQSTFSRDTVLLGVRCAPRSGPSCSIATRALPRPRPPPRPTTPKPRMTSGRPAHHGQGGTVHATPPATEAVAEHVTHAFTKTYGLSAGAPTGTGTGPPYPPPARRQTHAATRPTWPSATGRR